MLRVLGLDVEAWLWPSYSCMASANRPSNDICDLGLGFFFVFWACASLQHFWCRRAGSWRVETPRGREREGL